MVEGVPNSASRAKSSRWPWISAVTRGRRSRPAPMAGRKGANGGFIAVLVQSVYIKRTFEIESEAYLEQSFLRRTSKSYFPQFVC